MTLIDYMILKQEIDNLKKEIKLLKKVTKTHANLIINLTKE